MGKASSAKKIERVQRAGTTKAPGQRRNLGFPIAVVAIIIAGIVLVLLARDAKSETAAEAPSSVTGDHWHDAFGVYECDQYLPNIPDSGNDPNGIHTHGDGLMHIHPFGKAASGKNAVFGEFADATGIQLEDGKATLPVAMGGQVFEDGATCTITDEDGETTEVEAEVVMFVWPPQATENVEPEVFTGDFVDLRFSKDGEVWVLALVPKDTTTIPLPPTATQIPGATSDIESPNANPEADPSAPAEIPVDSVVPETTAPAGDGAGEG
jgi:hypothetical protein